MAKTKKKNDIGAFSRLGNFLGNIWYFIRVGRDFFWKAIRFTLATSIFLFVVAAILISILDPLFDNETKPKADGKVVVFSPDGIVVDQQIPKSQDQFTSFLGDEEVITYEFKHLVDFFEKFKEDEKVSGMIFDPSGLQISSAYAIPLAKKIKEAAQAGKEIIIRAESLSIYGDTAYLLSSGATEISASKYSAFALDGFTSTRLYQKDFFEKFLLTPRVFTAGDWKTGPEDWTRSNMSQEQKDNSYYIDRFWNAYKNFVKETRDVDLQWYADESYKDLIAGNVSFENANLEWNIIDYQEEEDDFNDRMLEKFGAAEDDEDELNAIYYRDYLKTFEKVKKSKSKNVIKVITVEGAITTGPVQLGIAGSDGLVKMLKAAHENENTKAIVLRVNSPGGSVVASEYIRWEIEKAQNKGIPIVVSMGSLAASGGYWVSSMADKIYAEENTITGSIGVYGRLLSFEKILEWAGLNFDSNSTTEFGGFNPVAENWPEEIIETFQANIDETYMNFTTQTSKDRDIPLEKVLEIARGRVWYGKDAVEIGLVDEIGTLEDAINFTADSILEIDDFKVDYVKPAKNRNSLNFAISLTEAISEFVNGKELSKGKMRKEINVLCRECSLID
mgnify:FL=1